MQRHAAQAPKTSSEMCAQVFTHAQIQKVLSNNVKCYTKVNERVTRQCQKVE